ncbi:MAG: hypothetical protein ABI610_08095, partial [Acidobacteriota bacterium]
MNVSKRPRLSTLKTRGHGVSVQSWSRNPNRSFEFFDEQTLDANRRRSLLRTRQSWRPGDSTSANAVTEPGAEMKACQPWGAIPRGAETESSRPGRVRELFRRARKAAALVIGLCLLSAVVTSEPASAEERTVPQLVKSGDAKIAAVPSIYPAIFPINATSATLVCINNLNADSEARLEPEDTFLTTLDELGLETFSMLSPILLVDSSTLEPSDFVALLDTENRRLVIRYVGESDSFEPGDSFCAQVSLNTSSLIGSRSARFDFPPFESRFSGAKQASYITFAVGSIGLTGPTGATGAAGADGGNGTNGTDGAVGPTGAAGAAGTTGATGAEGSNGAIGSAGVAGTDGTNGTNGANGVDGATGATGATGAAGVDGTNGIDGTNGLDGATGATGAAGVDGTNGTNGTNGLDGATGATGAAGVDGTNGINGTNGVDGAVGPTG